MTEEKIHKERHGSWWALSPLLVFLCLYLVTSILVNDFYKVPITVAFLVSSCYAIAITRGLKLDQRIYQFSVGAANKNILLMIWIFILAGAFAQSAKQMGAIDATVNLTLHILPYNLPLLSARPTRQKPPFRLLYQSLSEVLSLEITCRLYPIRPLPQPKLRNA